MSLLDEKLVRRFRTMMSRGVWDQPPARGPIPPEHAAIAMKLGAEGIVLLKNDGGQLPLKAGAIHSLAVIGPFAGTSHDRWRRQFACEPHPHGGSRRRHSETRRQ